MFHAQRFAIGVEGDQAVIHGLFQRDRTAVRAGIMAFDIDPLAFGLDTGLFQQHTQRNTDIFHVVDHAVGELRAVQLRAAPFHAAIRRAFAEIHMAFRAAGASDRQR